ncbi:MAG: DNA repair protein RecO [Desulfobacteraceae bacterium]|nr:DNA repair protein RecO [Desulfobacteraceae bacterium]
MTHFTTPAIVLRRRDYGDFDLILTVLTLDHGVVSLIAKSAKKSVKRFPGILEPFAGLNIVYNQGRGKGMMVLEEASLESTFGTLRSDILKTAYASYWAELVALWLEEGQTRPDIYRLMVFVLEHLVRDDVPAALLSLLFQMRFVGQEGLRPVLERCACCHIEVDQLAQQHFCIDLKQGGIVCHECPGPESTQLRLGKGTLKQLLWMADGDLPTALRVRFTPWALAEANDFLEAFVPFHIGRTPKSLGFLRQVRKEGGRG